MKKSFLKRMLSSVLAGTLIISAPLIISPVQVKAAWVWNAAASESGYPKVPVDQLSVAADSEETGAVGSDGPAAHAVDGNINSYWHTNWNGVNEVTGTPEEIADNNTITLTLEDPTDLAGITYLPRQYQASGNNGLIKGCKVYVSYDGTVFEEDPAAVSAWDYDTENWNESIAEKELLFAEERSGVKAVKIVVESARSTTTVPYINAAEIGLLMPKEDAEKNLVAIETEYWNKQIEAGEMENQTDTDEWLYQIKETDTGEWKNLGDEYFHADATPDGEAKGRGTWMQGGTPNLWYSKLSASQITSTFPDNNAEYCGAAYAWRAQEAGYYRATLATGITAANNDGVPVTVSYSLSSAPAAEEKILLPQTRYSAGASFVSKIVYAEKGDIIRIGVEGYNVWATGFEPAVEKVTVSEYAEQWLDENAYILQCCAEGGIYTGEKADAVNNAKAALDAALAEEQPNEENVKETLDALIHAVDNLLDVNAQADYWEKEYNAGTLGQQTEDDIWHYQIKAADGGWSDIAETDYHAHDSGEAACWLADGSQNAAYHWATIKKEQLTPCFKEGVSQYDGIAYAWKASEDGYAKVSFRKDVRSGNGSKEDVILTIAKGNAAEDSEILKQVTVPKGGTVEKEQLTTKIVKVSAGDYLRISEALADNDIYDVSPVVEIVTVREYAAQYLAEMDRIDTTGKPGVSAAEFAEAREDLRSKLDAETPAADEEITAAVTALENAEANLDLYTVTYQMGELERKIKGSYNDLITIILDASQVPAGQKFAGWCLDGEDVLISNDSEYRFYVVGDMTVTAKFVDEDQPTEIPLSASISNVNITQREDGKFDAQFIGLLTIPEGDYTINEAGMLWSPAAIATDKLAHDGPNLAENDQIRRVDVAKVSTAYQYSVTVKSIPSDRTVYAVAFAKITNNETHESQWVYSTEKSASVSGQD